MKSCWESKTNPLNNFHLQIEHTPSVMCITLAHHTLFCDWYNISLATVPDSEWLVYLNYELTPLSGHKLHCEVCLKYHVKSDWQSKSGGTTIQNTCRHKAQFSMSGAFSEAKITKKMSSDE